MDEKNKLPSIYNYNDFHLFLKEYQQARYAQDKGYSKSSLCMRMGLLNSRSYFNDVLNGKKVTPTFVSRFIEVLDLDHDEAQFFRVLVKFNQAEDLHERELYFSQLIALNKAPKKKIDPDVFELYRTWRHSVVRSMLNVVDCSDDGYALLAGKILPRVTAKEVKESIELLCNLGLVEKNEQGYYKPTDKAISTGNRIRHELVTQYQLQCLSLAQEALLKNRNQPREFYTNCISISAQGYERLQQLVDRFKSQVRSLVHKDEHPADRVYHLDLQLFPESKAPKRKT